MPGYFSHYTLRLLGLFFVIKQHLFCQIHRTLFALLKGWRKEEAQRQGVPPYVICPDATLRDIAWQKPRSLGLLADVQGMGEKRLECYGKALAAIVRKFVQSESVAASSVLSADQS